ncbi:unnamed protein product [Clonostachys chloroleuca]|uniref:Uncharacterized protein n=1 Tax=Clonostachys chloroleuca TaxID=1926264 RepID=A0AA35Q6J1_9HYPO|nr:unnamed protein product [Clonostachys chloroleuca]
MDRTNRGGWWSSEEKASRAELMLCGADEEAPLAYDVYKYGFTDRQAIKTTTIENDRIPALVHARPSKGWELRKNLLLFISDVAV